MMDLINLVLRDDTGFLSWVHDHGPAIFVVTVIAFGFSAHNYRRY